MTWNRHALKVVALVVIVAAVGGSWCQGQAYGERRAANRLTLAYVRQIADLGRLVITERNKTGDLMSAIGAMEDPPVAAGVVAATHGVITHVGAVEIQLPPEVREVIVEIPADLQASAPCMLGVLEIGQASVSGSALRCETYGLNHRVTFAVADISSTALVQFSTPQEPDEWHDVDAALEVTYIPPEPHKIISPGVTLGVTLGVSLPSPQPLLTASLAFQWLHVSRSVDLLGVRVSGNSTQLRFGVDVVGYTPGIKPFRNTGLYLGASQGIDGSTSVDLTLGVRL